MTTHATDDQLIDYLHGELVPEADALLHAHLAACGECRARYDAEAALGESLRAELLAEDLELPSMVKARIWAAIRAEQPTVLDRVRAFIRPAFVVPVAAVFAVALYLGAPLVHLGSSSPPAVAAAYYFEEHQAEGQANPLADRQPGGLISTDKTADAGAPLIDAAEAATLDPAVNDGS